MGTPISPTDPLALQLIHSIYFIDETQPNAPVAGSGYFGDQMQLYFDGLNDAQKQAIWLKFLDTYDLNDPPAVTAQTQQLFANYLKNVYRQLQEDVLGSDSLYLDLTLFSPPAGSYFKTIFDSAFSTYSPDAQQRLWVLFLKNYGYLTQAPVDDAVTQKSFLIYLERLIVSNGDISIAIPELPQFIPPTSGPYAAFFSAVNGVEIPNSNPPPDMVPLSPEQKQKIWVQFLLEKNLTDYPSSGDLDLIQTFRYYILATIEHLILTLDATSDMLDLQPPTNGFYGEVMASYFAGLTPVQQQKVWVQYLVNNQLTTFPLAIDAVSKKNFMLYVGAVYNSLQTNEFSPDEVKKRVIMTNTFNSLLEMLITLQDTIGVTARNLIFYGTWQQEYTKMLSRTPVYVAQSDSTVKVPATVNADTDFTQFTFGYNNISVDDIAQWWSYNSLRGIDTPFVINSTSKLKLYDANTDDLIGEFPEFSVKFTPQVGTTAGFISWTEYVATATKEILVGTFPFQTTQTIVVSADPVTYTVSIPLQPAQNTFPVTGGGQLTNALTTYVKSFETGFVTAWNGSGVNSIVNVLASVNTSNLAAINFDPDKATDYAYARSKEDTSQNSAMEIPWIMTYVAPQGTEKKTTKGNISDKSSKARAEINTRDQGYIENTRGLRKNIQNQAEQLQSNLDVSKQTVSDQADLLTSILDSIRSIISSIFK